MKEIISAVVMLAMMFGGSVALKGLYSIVQRAALEKAAKGLPSLTQMTHALQQKKKGPSSREK